MLSKELHKLAKSLSLTDLQELEPYVLTPEEESRAVEQAVISSKQLAAWKMNRMQCTQDEIFSKLSRINWEETIDREKVLKLANTAKLQELWRGKQKVKRRQEEESQRKELEQFWTYTRVFNLMKWNSEHVFGKPLIQSENNLKAIKAICFFISRNDRFFTELKDDHGRPYRPLSGLLLRGPSGSGKTHLVRCVENNGLNPILTQSVLAITDQLKDQGEFKFQINGHRIIYLDDVGTEEPVVNYYGTKITWFKNFIEGIYLKSKVFNHLIISTNLNWQGIGEMYGYRVESRMREMFNVIDLTGKDRRR
jgi:DNA replication protein DnaC